MFLSYLRGRVRTAAFFLLCAVIVGAVFLLYDLPTEGLLYALALCLAAGAVFVAADYYVYAKKLRAVRDLRDTVTVDISRLPEPSDAPELEYQELIRTLYSAERLSESRAEENRREARDYYTLWAHQIKTPISSMYLILQNGHENSVPRLRAELLRTEQYVDMALNYARLDGEASDLVLREYPLDDLLRACLRKYAPMFIAQKLSVDFTGTGKTVLTDERWLSFVIGQLLGNSLKYTRHGCVSVYFENDSLVIGDTGIGIAPEDLPRVFERGFTGYNGREDRKSTGLGLYLSRRVCDMLGHGLRLESEPGAGTRAYISFSDERLLCE